MKILAPSTSVSIAVPWLEIVHCRKITSSRLRPDTAGWFGLLLPIANVYVPPCVMLITPAFAAAVSAIQSQVTKRLIAGLARTLATFCDKLDFRRHVMTPVMKTGDRAHLFCVSASR